tara:strand:+ start:2033 stop:2986 length:954 start_codon:yes stop_codon:yes gene_type:complete
LEKLKVLDLFSGIGGFSLGLHRTGGFETVAFVERENYAQKVLAKNFPDIPIFDDVKDFGVEQTNGLGRIDVVTGGYPCQPFSQAGQRRGAEDDRHLWPEMARIIRQCNPTWVVAENVAGHITMGLDEVLSDLESQGYATRPFVIPACAVDAPHRRDRVWIIAHANGKGESNGSEHGKRLEDVSHTNGIDRGRGEELGQPKGNTPRQPIIDSRKLLAHSDSIRPQREREKLNDVEPTRLCDRETKRTEGKRFSQQRLGGSLDGVSVWLDGTWEDGIPRVSNGEKGRAERLKGLGNAVVPQIVTIIGYAILQAEKGTTL